MTDISLRDFFYNYYEGTDNDDDDDGMLKRI